jgi:hypothetical protein
MTEAVSLPGAHRIGWLRDYLMSIRAQLNKSVLVRYRGDVVYRITSCLLRLVMNARKQTFVRGRLGSAHF